jgi:FkbM family methyltransferase
LESFPEAELVRNLADVSVRNPRMIQIGANDGRTEYSKKNEKDFVFEFLHQNPKWSAVLVEPVPEVFETLKSNYADRRNELVFLNCAIAERTGYREFYVCGRDGKRSSLIKEVTEGHSPRQITVPTLNYEFLCRMIGWDRVDFVKIDSEGYDTTIVQQILACETQGLIPDVIYWERGNHSDRTCEDRLIEMGFRVFRSGLSKGGVYMDRLAMRTADRSIPVTTHPVEVYPLGQAGPLDSRRPAEHSSDNATLAVMETEPVRAKVHFARRTARVLRSCLMALIGRRAVSRTQDFIKSILHRVRNGLSAESGHR